MALETPPRQGDSQDVDSKARQSASEHAGKESNRRKTTWITGGVIAFVIVSAAGLTFVLKNKSGDAGGVSGQKAAQLPPVVTVTVEPASLKAMQRILQINGTIWPWDPLNIGSEVNGLRIDHVNVEEGDRVKRGQVLCTLNSEILKAQLDQEVAHLAAMEANVKKAIQPNRPEDLAALRAAREQAEAAVAQEEANLVHVQANLTNAQENARRYRDLARQGAVSAQDADNWDTQAKTSTADLHNSEHRVRAARFSLDQYKQRLAMAEVGGRKEDIDISRASVAESRANVRRLKAEIEQTIIRSPCDGLVMKRDAHIGDITSAGKSLFQLVRDNRLELRAQVPEVDLAKIHAGQAVAIKPDLASRQSVPGRVREISPLIDQDSRLGTVRVDLLANDTYKPGNFVHGEINLGQGTVLTLPSQAVQTKDNQAFVYLLREPNQVQIKFITTGARTGGLVEILSGLSEGDRVVVKGAGFLKDGDVVRIGG